MARHKQLHQFATDIWRSKREGASYNTLQQAWKCSQATIIWHVNKVDEEIKEAFGQGVSRENLAQQYGVNIELINKVLEADGQAK